MMRFLQLLLFVLFGCLPGPQPPAGPDVKIFDETVALVTDEDGAYCSGVWVGQKTILSAFHCITDEPEYVHVRTRDGDRFDARVVRTNEQKDLAALEVSNPPPHAWPVLASDWYEGEFLSIVGHPAGFGEWSWRAGWITKGRHTTGPKDNLDVFVFVLQTNIWFGNSGGPAFDKNGNLVGICSMLSNNGTIGYFVALPEIRAFLTGQ